jgi:hypothetical protein
MPGFRRIVLFAGLLLGFAAQVAVVRADTSSSEPIDPPEAAGRIAVMSGTVLFRADPSQAAAPAVLNYPLSLGNVVETAPEAHATIDIAAGRFYLDAGARLRIGALADGSSAVALEQGALVLHVLRGGDGQVFTIATAKGTLRVDQSGYYEVEIGAGDLPTIVSALEGGAQFLATSQGDLVLHPRDRIALTGGTAQRDVAVEDDLIRRVAAEVEGIGENTAVAPEHVSTQMTGYQDLARYGFWELTESYGPVWKPEVGSDWSPYGRGRWVDVAPWGKTWVDDAPWGFAPFHYGRWIKLNQRWAWLPGDTGTPPVYAPALVSFFDTPKDQKSALRWIPLGPEEPYLPPYPTSIVYFRAINQPAIPAVVKITNIINIVQITNVVKIVKRRPVFVFSRLVNVPGAPPPKPRPRPNGIAGTTGPAIVVTGSGPQLQTGVIWRPIVSETRTQTGSVVVVSPSQPTTPATTWNEPGFLVQPTPIDQQPVVIIRNNPPVVMPGTGAGGGTTSPPVVVTRPMPSNSVTLGTGTPLGTQATMPSRPTVTFGASPGPNGVTFP